MKKITTTLWNRPFLIFLLFVIVAYLPVLLPFFHLKNDLITQNLPTRFVISESLYSGYFPWWNPYIHYGIPQYGDMNNGFWNPFLWLIAKTTGYSLSTITLEEMFYILIGGWGMYKLVKDFGSKETAFIAGLSYMCCGYITGHLQHFIWITGTAFFPYLLLFFFRTHKQPLLKNFIATAFSIFLLLASTHPGIIIGGIYFFLFLVLLIYFFRNSFFANLYSHDFCRINGILMLLGLLLSCVVIVSNIDVLSHISRSKKVSGSELLLFPTTLQSYISLLVPLAVNKSTFFDTDISMRNIYIGLFNFIGLIVFFKAVSNKWKFAVTIPLLFFILLSAGGIFKKIFSAILPGLSYVRLNGEFTYFVLLICLFAAAAGIELILKKELHQNFPAKILKIIKWVFISGTIISLIFILLIDNPGVNFLSGNNKAIIKSLIDNLHFNHLLFFSCIIQLLTIIAIQKSFNRNTLLLINGLNLIIFTWLTLPFTGLGMDSRKNISKTIESFPKGIYTPALTAIEHAKYIDSSDREKLWLLSSYSKNIGYPLEEKYPVQLKSTAVFFANDSLHQFINRQAWLFLSFDTTIASETNFDNKYLQILSFQPGYVKAKIKNKNFRYITLLQNDYPYWQVKINGKAASHFTGYSTFISADLPGEESEVEFIFDPKPVRYALIFSMLIAFLFISILIVGRWRNYRLFKK